MKTAKTGSSDHRTKELILNKYNDKKKIPLKKDNFSSEIRKAEAVGFEPTVPVKGLPDFESGPL